jgi:hypothetical protein
MKKGTYAFPSREVAVKKAVSLLKLFSNKGWTYRVWENMGWHIVFYNKKAGRAAVQVHWDNREGQFSCLVCNCWAMFNGTTYRSKKDPVQLVKRSIKYAEKNLLEIQDIFDQSRKAVI